MAGNTATLIRRCAIPGRSSGLRRARRHHPDRGETWTVDPSMQCSVFPGPIVNIAGYAAEDDSIEVVIDYGGPTRVRVGGGDGPVSGHAVRNTIDIDIRSKSDWVFTNRSGKPWSMSAIQSAIRRLDVSWTFHALRATADADHETGLGLIRRYNRARRLRAVK